MANIKNIEIKINKEVAKQAYEAGARWAFDDEAGILTIEGFDKYWNDLQERVKAININESTALHLHNVSQQRELLIGLLTKLENGGGSAFIDKEQIVDDYLKANIAVNGYITQPT